MAISTPTSAGSATANNGTAVVAMTFTASFSVGDFAIGIAWIDETGHVLNSVTDSAGNTWQIDVQVNNAVSQDTSGRRVAIFSSKITNAITSGVTTATATFATAAGTVKGIAIAKVTGLATTSWFDKSASTTGSVAGWSSGATATLTQADELVIGAAVCTWASSVSSTAGGTYTELFDIASVDVTGTMEYKIVAATTAVTGDGTWSTARQWAAAVATYKGAAGATKAIAPDAINATSGMSASVQKLAAVKPATINATSAMTAALQRLRPIPGASITTTSPVTASLSRIGLKPLAGASVQATSTVTATLTALHVIVPAAVAATSTMTARVNALHRITPATITATSFVTATVTTAGGAAAVGAPNDVTPLIAATHQ